MTFSDRRIIEAVNRSFVPVWESVAPASVAVFDLGDGKKVQGTIGGEIALYFCRPDGKVFDCLPALQSPAITLQAIERAAAFYATADDPTVGPSAEDIQRHNTARRDAIAKENNITPQGARSIVDEAHRQLKLRMAMGGDADDALTVARLSKSAITVPAETITVVEPGGLWLYSIQIHDRMAREALKTPDEWKHAVFEAILDQKLEGGTRVFSSMSVAPMSLLPDDG